MPTKKKPAVEVDPEADAAYVGITDEPVDHTHQMGETLLVDHDSRGGIVGIEVMTLGTPDLPGQCRAEGCTKTGQHRGLCCDHNRYRKAGAR